MRMVFDAKDQYPSQWAAIESIAGKIGCTGETLRKWVRQGLSEFLCAGLGDLSTAAGVACDERPTRWASRCRIVMRGLHGHLPCGKRVLEVLTRRIRLRSYIRP